MFQIKVVEKIKHNFRRKSCRLCDNVEKYFTHRQTADDNTMQLMCVTCCIVKATDTHSEYVISFAFLRQQLLH